MQVMLDSDLAKLYNVETKALNQVVRPIASALDTQLFQLLPKLITPSQFLESPGEYIPRKHK
jgi:hypothetical protein